MNKGIITPKVALEEDCAVVEKQLLQIIRNQKQQLLQQQQKSPSTSSSIPARCSGGKSTVAAIVARELNAFVDCVLAPELDNMHVTVDYDEEEQEKGEEEDEDENDFEDDINVDDAVIGVSDSLGDNSRPQNDQQSLYWPDDDNGNKHNTKSNNNDNNNLNKNESPSAGVLRAGTALEHGLTAEQYLYVVATHCQV